MALKLSKTAEKLKYSMRQLNRTDSNILNYIAYSLLFDIVITMYKPFALKFLERIGGDEFHISLYNSVPGLIAIFTLVPGSLFIAGFRKKKNVTAAFFVAARLLILPLSILPFIEKSWQPMAFIIITGLMNLPDAVSQTALQSFLGENFEGRVRATAISLRTKFGQIMTLSVTFLTALILRIVPKTQEQTIIIYQLFFCFAFIAAVFEVIVFLRFKERSAVIEARKPSLKSIGMVFRNRRFTKYLLLTLLYYFTWQLAWPVIGMFQVMELQADELWFALIAVSSGLATFLAASFWGKQINRLGNSRVLVIAMLGVTGNMILYSFVSGLFSLILINIYGGFFGAAITISLLNGLLENTPDEDRVIYIAVYNSFINTSLAVTPFIAYALVSLFSYQQVFLIDTFLRLAATITVIFCYRKTVRWKGTLAKFFGR